MKLTSYLVSTQSLESQLTSVESAKAELTACLAESRTAMATLQGDLATALTDRQTGEEKHEQEMSDLRLDLLGKFCYNMSFISYLLQTTHSRANAGVV